MSFPQYPTYKESGVEWLGEVPEHWDVVRLKRAAHVFPSNVDKKSYDDETPVRLCNYTDVYYNDTISAELDFMPATASSEQIAKFTLRAGDTIITKDSETADDIAVAAHVPADLPGVVCGYHLSIVRPAAGYSGAFIKRLFDSAYVKASAGVLANGLTRVGLGQHELDNIELPFPPHAEQGLLARFLDRETAKIDALIAEQQRLIELLKEKRQAVISHAVTRGLNPDAPTKASGVEWLGEVPAHWTVCPVSARYEVQLGKMLDSARITGRHLRPYLRVADVQWGNINTSELPLMDFDDDDRAKFALRAGDIIVNEGGSYVGRSAIWRGELEECYYQKALHRLRPRDQASDDPAYFLHVMFFATTNGVFVAGNNQNTIDHLPAEKLRRYRFAFPPLEEQRTLACRLDAMSRDTDSLVAEAERAIALFQERRAALISAAVTGKIDVRHLADAEAA